MLLGERPGGGADADFWFLLHLMSSALRERSYLQVSVALGRPLGL